MSPKDRGGRRPQGRGRGVAGPDGPKGRARPGAGAGRPRPPRPGANPSSAPASRPSPGGDVLYGIHPVQEVLRARRRRVHAVWATAGVASEDWLRGVPVTVADAAEVAARAGSDAHQGVCAAVDPYPYVTAEAILAAPAPLLVALDEVQDPQNLGAIARTAECAGAAGLVIPVRRSAEVTAAAAKASAGAVEHLPVARVRNLADFLADAKAAGLWVYGAEARAPTGYAEADFAERCVLVLGAEGKGLRPRVRASCDVLVSLPLRGRIGSLNVSATAAVLLYEAARTRGS